MPTRTGLGASILGFAVLIGGRTFGIFELFIVGAALLALVAMAVLWVVFNWRAVSVLRQVAPARLHVGDSSLVTLALSNDRVIPSPVAQITDEVNGVPRADAHVPPMGRGSSTRASYRLPADRRGRIDLGPMQTRVTDPFALASVVRESASDTSVLVLPAYDVIAPPPQPGGSLAVMPDRSPGRIGPSGEEFSALRPYVVGDDMRKVHWPSTARSGELVVRTEHLPEHGDSLVLVDVRERVADAETFEKMVSAATSIVIACRERGDSLRMVTTAGSDLQADDQLGFDRILDFLAMVGQSSEGRVRVAPTTTPAGSAVAVLGSSYGFLDALTPAQTLSPSTIAVRFKGVDTPRYREDTVPQRRMISVGPTDDFATIWESLFVRPNSEARAPQAGPATADL